MPSLPPPVLAALGLAADTIDRARKEVERLPDSAVELPMTLVSLALQASMRINQEYARLIGRGEELVNRLQVSEEPPPWATFDDETDPDASVTDLGTPPSPGTSRFDAVADDDRGDD